MGLTSNQGFHWIDKPLEGIFGERLNRFACSVTIAGSATKVYLPNSGRLEELLRPGARVIVEKRRQSGKTHHDLLLIETSRYPEGEPIWAALDSRLPPKLLGWAIRQGLIKDLPTLADQRAEPAIPSGRLDLKLSYEGLDHYIETKSVNLVDQSGLARFPDAPTRRGQRHLQELINLKAQGHQASLVFIVVRHDPLGLAPFVERDPAFSQALVEAERAGVPIHAYKFKAEPTVHYRGSIPVNLDPDPFPGYWPPMQAGPGAHLRSHNP